MCHVLLQGEMSKTKSFSKGGADVSREIVDFYPGGHIIFESFFASIFESSYRTIQTLWAYYRCSKKRFLFPAWDGTSQIWEMAS